MDGDVAAKAMDKGASAATKHVDLTDGIHEDAKADLVRAPGGEKTFGSTGAPFDAKGSIGKQFTTDGAIGGTAQSIGGPLDKDGVIGKQFTTGGSIGAAAQNILGSSERK